MPVRRKEANYPDPLNGVRVMIEFQRPSHDVSPNCLGLLFMNKKDIEIDLFAVCAGHGRWSEFHEQQTESSY